MDTWLDEQDPAKVADALKALRDPASAAGARALQYSNGDDRFALWLRQVDYVAGRRLGVSIFDLADYTWRDAYENGDSPQRALRDALAEDDTYSALFH